MHVRLKNQYKPRILLRWAGIPTIEKYLQPITYQKVKDPSIELIIKKWYYFIW